MSNNRIVEGLVIARSPKSSAYFVRVRSIQRVVLLCYQLCDPNKDLFGKWVRMTIDYRDRACAPVEVIDDLFETRMTNPPEVLTKCTHSHSFKNRFELFHSDYFGLICDSGKIISRIEQGASYNLWITPIRIEEANTCWVVSERQNTLAPINTSEKTRLFKLTGIVISPTTGGYFVWSNQMRNSPILLKYDQCNRDEDFVGKWVEMEVDQWNVVAKPVTVIPDKFRTEMSRGSFEIRAEFQQDRRSKNQIDIFYHAFFGNICDGRRLVFAEPGAWYAGWIEFYEDTGNHSWWRLSVEPKLIRPAERQFCGDHASRSHSPGNSHRESRRRSSDAKRYEGERRRLSPDGRNNARPSDSQNYRSPSRYNQRRRTPSPDQRNYRETHSPPRRYAERPLSPNPIPPVKRPSSQYLGSEASSFVSRDEETTAFTRRPEDVEGLSTRTEKMSVTGEPSTNKPYNPHEIARRRREKQALIAASGSGSSEYVTAEERIKKEVLQEQIRQLQMKIESMGAVMSRFLGNKELRDMLEKQDPAKFIEMLELFEEYKK